MKIKSTFQFPCRKYQDDVAGMYSSFLHFLPIIMLAILSVLFPGRIFAEPFNMPGPASADSVPYNVVGNSFQDTTSTGVPDSCYSITTDFRSESGAVWNNKSIDLSYSFDLKFNITLGSNNPNNPDENLCGIGADGICFVLQNYNTGTAETGGGIGYAGFPNQSLAVEFDDFQNSWDPPYSHIAIEDSGVVNHQLPNGHLAGPVQMSNSEYYTADGNWHTAEITWNPQLDTMAVFFDDTFRVGLNFDSLGGLFQGVFKGLDSTIYWGFTGSTGTWCNNAQVCMTSIQFVSTAVENVTPNQEEVKVYPNPSNNILYVESSKFLKNIILLDITGRVVESWQVNLLKTNFSTSNLAEGAYFLKISNEDESSVIKQIAVVH